MISDTDVAWAAGLFDGEGCIHIPQKTGPRVALRLAMTDEATVKEFGRIIGVPYKMYVIDRKNPKWKVGYSWHIVKQSSVKDALLLMLPYLRLKRHKAVAGLAELGKMPYTRRVL